MNDGYDGDDGSGGGNGGSENDGGVEASLRLGSRGGVEHAHDKQQDGTGTQSEYQATQQQQQPQSGDEGDSVETVVWRVRSRPGFEAEADTDSVTSVLADDMVTSVLNRLAEESTQKQ